jgi:hypothetical protein
MTSVFHQLLQNEAFVDVTLACNDLSLKAHKVVLSACSSYFQKLLLENPCKHPTIIMPQDVCYADLKFIIEFVYKGEIDVSQTELQSLLRTADQLKIKGLCEPPDEKENSPIEPQYFAKGFSKVRKSSSPKQFKPQDNNKRNKQKKPHLDNTSDKEDNGSVDGHSSDEEHDMPVALNEHKRKRAEPEQIKPLNMSSHGIMTGQVMAASITTL